MKQKDKLVKTNRASHQRLKLIAVEREVTLRLLIEGVLRDRLKMARTLDRLEPGQN